MADLDFSSEAFDGLSSREKLVYATLHEEHPATTQSVAERLGTSPQNVRNALEKLEERNLVKSRPDRRIHANAMAWMALDPQL